MINNLKNQTFQILNIFNIKIVKYIITFHAAHNRNYFDLAPLLSFALFDRALRVKLFS